MGSHAISTANLVYNGEVIHAKADMLSLTDMWKAAGSDDARRPANWSRKEGAEFIAHMEAVLNVPDGHIIRTGRGRNGGTFAHWQIGLAYAKYLSTDFHMWCNTVVRAVMEGAPVTTALPDDLGEIIRRVDGIARMLSHKVTTIEGSIGEIVGEAIERKIASDPRVAVISYVSVRQILADDWKVPAKGRRSIQRKVFLLLQAHCLSEGIKAFRCAHSGTWLFPPHEASAFVRKQCGLIIREHIERMNGQGRLRLISGDAPRAAAPV